MPPKPRFTREEVVDAAYALLEEGGMEAVVAREVGRRLGCTVAPIFTCFENMDDLRAAVHRRALDVFAAYMQDCVDYFPAFKEFGLRWVRLAKEHPQVYRELFLREGADAPGGLTGGDFWQSLQPILAEVALTFSIPAADAERLMRDMLIYVHGLAAMGAGEMTEEELRVSLSRMCISLVAGMRVRDGGIDAPQLRHMMAHLDMIPRRRTAGDGLPGDLPEHTAG